MSASKSDYPNRPARRNAPKSSHRGSKKSRIFYTVGTPQEKPVEKVAYLDIGLCHFGHTNPAREAFLASGKRHKVPVHEYNKKGRTLLV